MATETIRRPVCPACKSGMVRVIRDGTIVCNRCGVRTPPTAT